jgi:hypothetical protein
VNFALAWRFTWHVQGLGDRFLIQLEDEVPLAQGACRDDLAKWSGIGLDLICKGHRPRGLGPRQKKLPLRRIVGMRRDNLPEAGLQSLSGQAPA